MPLRNPILPLFQSRPMRFLEWNGILKPADAQNFRHDPQNLSNLENRAQSDPIECGQGSAKSHTNSNSVADYFA
jgi:hypothetical protein